MAQKKSVQRWRALSRLTLPRDAAIRAAASTAASRAQRVMLAEALGHIVKAARKRQRALRTIGCALAAFRCTQLRSFLRQWQLQGCSARHFQLVCSNALLKTEAMRLRIALHALCACAKAVQLLRRVVRPHS